MEVDGLVGALVRQGRRRVLSELKDFIKHGEISLESTASNLTYLRAFKKMGLLGNTPTLTKRWCCTFMVWYGAFDEWKDAEKFVSEHSLKKIRTVPLVSAKNRYEALKNAGGQCALCGRKPPEVRLQVDHIKPRSKYPSLADMPTNLQVLCWDCNIGKSNRDQTDWRPNESQNSTS